MHAKRIIPCLDVNNGRVVKGTSFVNLRDAGDPVEAAIAYDKQGADELVLLDITASHEGRGTMLHIVQEVAKHIFIPFTVGGGVRTVEDINALLRAGADKVSVNTAAWKIRSSFVKLPINLEANALFAPLMQNAEQKAAGQLSSTVDVKIREKTPLHGQSRQPN